MKHALFTSLALATAVTANAQSFSTVQSQADDKLEAALQELATLQETIAAEKIPLATELNGLKIEVDNLSDEQKRLERLRDARDLNPKRSRRRS